MRQLPSDLSSKINQSLQTIGNNANPKMSIQVSRAKDTVMDSSYWTVETIRTKEGLGDLSIAAQRLTSKGNPTRLYNIYVDNGIVKTAIREYPDIKKEKWKTQFELGAGNAVATAFDGEWEFYRKRWQLKTYEKPFIFWVNSGALWTQLWDDTDTLFELASEVTRVKAIRGWKNPLFIDKDQGIVAGYIKTDGLVYYRGWCAQADGSTIWENEHQLLEFTGVAVNLNMFITNDYRMGFIIEDNLGIITTFITFRNWAGMATTPENIVVGIKDITLDVYSIEYTDFIHDEHLTTGITDIFLNAAEPIYPLALSANNGNEEKETIWLLFNHEIYSDVTLAKIAFTIKDSLGTTFNILSIEQEMDKSVIIFNMAHFGAASGDMTITYDRTKYSLDCLNQGSLFAVESFALPFTPALTPPEGFVDENITVSIAPKILVSQVYYHSMYTEENIQVGMANINILVTKVGNNPL